MFIYFTGQGRPSGWGGALAGRGRRYRYVGPGAKAPFAPWRARAALSLCWPGGPRAFCALAGGGLLLAKVWLLYSLGYGPKPSYASGGGFLSGAFWCPSGQGYVFIQDRIPFGNPYGQTNSGLRLRRPKGRACLRNRSLVVPDKVPPADLYVEPKPFIFGWPRLTQNHRNSGNSLGVPLVRPSEESILHMAEGAPKGVPPFGFPHGQTHSGLRLRGTKGRSRLRNRSLVALIKCLRRILGCAVGNG